MSSMSIVCTCACVSVVRVSSGRLNIVSSISSVVGNSIDAIALFGASILSAGDDIIGTDDTGSGGGGIVVVGAGACIVTVVCC